MHPTRNIHQEKHTTLEYRLYLERNETKPVAKLQDPKEQVLPLALRGTDGNPKALCRWFRAQCCGLLVFWLLLSHVYLGMICYVPGCLISDKGNHVRAFCPPADRALKHLMLINTLVMPRTWAAGAIRIPVTEEDGDVCRGSLTSPTCREHLKQQVSTGNVKKYPLPALGFFFQEGTTSSHMGSSSNDSGRDQVPCTDFFPYRHKCHDHPCPQ